MQNINDNIDLDALFDMLNIGSGTAAKPSEAEKAFISHLDPTTHEVPDLSPLGMDYFIIDLPIDQS